jgi:hypothetical protein
VLNYYSMQTLEDVKNFTICVKETNGIRNMNLRNDINCDLIYVNNIECDNCDFDDVIKKGTSVRCVDIVLMPKIRF